MKIEVGKTYECADGAKWKIVHKLEAKQHTYPYIGVVELTGAIMHLNESGTNWARSIQLLDEPKEPALETFPVDAWVRQKNTTEYYRVLSVSSNDVALPRPTGLEYYSWSYLIENFEYSVDGCKTWHPCGVKE